jgi:hypothetical protein
MRSGRSLFHVGKRAASRRLRLRLLHATARSTSWRSSARGGNRELAARRPGDEGRRRGGGEMTGRRGEETGTRGDESG